MDHNHGNGYMGPVLLFGSWGLTYLSQLNKQDITFFFSVTVSTLAIIHYLMQISKAFREKRERKKQTP